MKEQRDPLDNRIKFTYDLSGIIQKLVEIEHDPIAGSTKSFQTSLTHDARGRLIKAADSLGNEAVTNYDDRDVVISVIDPLGGSTSCMTDALGRLVGVRSTGAGWNCTHSWVRDELGRVTRYSDPAGRTTRYSLGWLDNWIAVESPDGGVHRRQFGSDGLLNGEVGYDGSELNLKRGADGTVSQAIIVPAVGRTGVDPTVYERDGLGRIIKAIRGTDTINFGYDVNGRTVLETDGVAALRWAHDDVNGVSDLIRSDGRIDRYEKDLLGRISKIRLHQLGSSGLTGPRLSTGDTLASYAFAGPLRVRRRTLSSGAWTEYDYDQGRRLTSLAHFSSGGQSIAAFEYAYDALSRRCIIRRDAPPASSQRFGYDTLSRLVSAGDIPTLPQLGARTTQADSDTLIAAINTLPASNNWTWQLSPGDEIQGRSSGGMVETVSLDALGRPSAVTHTSSTGSTTENIKFDTGGCRIRMARMNTPTTPTDVCAR